MIRAALLLLLACARVAAADADADADRAFRSALASGDIDALERLGTARPVTRWTDDAWSEAARLAVRAQDYARARRDLEQAIATSGDPLLVRRARTELARIAALVGDSGQWTAVVTEHERLVGEVWDGGDPTATLRALEALVRAHPQYPRRSAAMLSIAAGWEREGEGDAAVRWLREARTQAAVPLDKLRAHAELVRTLIRLRELADAERELVALGPAAPRSLVAELRMRLERATWRRSVRWAMWAVLGLLGAVAAVSLRCVGVRRLVRPPTETLFLLPLAAVLVAIAYTGNPLVARAVRTIVIAGVAASRISGAILRGRNVTAAVAASTYIAVDDGRLIDFVLETWRAGHERG